MAGGVNPRNLIYRPPSPRWSQFMVIGIVISGYFIGRKMDRWEYNREILFRDKSSLFKGINPDPVNNPSWGSTEASYIFEENKPAQAQ